MRVRALIEDAIAAQVETPEEVDALSFPPDAKLALLTQTTLSVDEAERVISRLRERFPQIVSARITIRKPNAPVPGVLDHVEVTVEHDPRG